MKRKIAALLASLLTLSLFAAGCGAPPPLPSAAATPADTAAPQRLTIVTTIFPQYDFARQIAGEYADIAMLLPPGSESHSYEPTPQDILKIQNCDIFIYIGGESDAWVEQVLESMDTSSMQVLTLMDCADLVEEEIVEGMQADKEKQSGDEEAEYDEHIWTSPQNAVRMAEKIALAMIAADPANKDAYRANADAYIAALKELDQSFQQIANSAARKTLVFGDRFPFRYFADAYALTYYAAFPGCSTQAEPSAATVAFLIDKVKAEGIPVVFHIEFSNEKMADTIAEATGAKKLLLHSCHNVTKAEFASGVTYLALMRQNAENLKEALN